MNDMTERSYTRAVRTAAFSDNTHAVIMIAIMLTFSFIGIFEPSRLFSDSSSPWRCTFHDVLSNRRSLQKSIVDYCFINSLITLCWTEISAIEKRKCADRVLCIRSKTAQISQDFEKAHAQIVDRPGSCDGYGCVHLQEGGLMALITSGL